MPRTVANVEATGATFKHLTIRMIDRTGDKRAVGIDIDAAATNAQIESLVQAIADGSNASVYEVIIGSVWSSVPDNTNAVQAVNPSVYDQVLLSFKKPNKQRQGVILPAPIEDMFVTNTDQIDLGNSVYADWRDAVEAVLEGAYEPVSVRFTERSEVNQAQPAT